MFFFQFLTHPSFKKKKIFIIKNCIILVIFILLKKNKIIEISSGKNKFLFNFRPLKRYYGSRGLFIYREDYEPLLKNCHKLINRNDLILDIGANQGIYSLAFSKLTGPNGNVVAFEPFDKMAEYLKNNVELNNLKNIKIYQKVISDKVGYEILDFGRGIVSASIVRKFSSDKKIKIESTTIDQITKDCKKVNFIKMDIEGAELKALIGAEMTLKKHKPILSLEVNRNSFLNIYNFLKPFGYKPYAFDQNGNMLEIGSIKDFYPTLIFKVL